MSTFCTTCGEPLADEDDRCPTCGALASPDVDESVEPEAPPWSIPIREPAVTHPEASRPSRRGLALLALAIVAFVLTVVVGSRLLDDDDGATSSAADTDEVGVEEPAGIDPTSLTTEAPATTTTAAAPTTTATSVEAPTATAAPTTTAAPPTTLAVRTAPNGTGSVPALSTSFRGWVAQLRSVPYTAGTAALADEWERTRAVADGVVALRSDDWAGLGDGFWVLVDPGPFTDADEVRSSCAAAGLEGDDACLARELRG